MNEEMLAQLRQFLALETNASAEEIAAALEALIAQLRTPPASDGAATYAEEEVADMRSALKAATNDDLLTKLEQIQIAVQGVSARKSAMSALTEFADAFETALAQPQPTRIPLLAAGAENQQLPTRQQPRGAKSRSYNPLAQIGHTPKPGIVDMVRDLKAGKAQSYQTGPQGGYLTRHEVSPEILAALRDKLPLFDMGVREYPMTGTESLTIVKITGEMEAYWVGEGVDITDSKETYDVVTLQPKPVAARVIVPNKLLANTAANYEATLRDDMTHKLQRAIMRAALAGGGGGAEPRGIINTPDVTITELGSGDGDTPEFEDLINMQGRIEDANVDETDSWRWLFSPRTKRTFTNKTDMDGRPMLRMDWASGVEKELLGHEWRTSTVVPNDLTEGTSSDCSRIFLADWQYLALGMSNSIEILVLDRTDLARKLQTEIIAFTYVDVAVLYAEAFEVLTGVRA